MLDSFPKMCSTFDGIYTDPRHPGVLDEIEVMSMCIEFGTCSSLARNSGTCTMSREWRVVVLRAVYDWGSSAKATPCALYLKQVFNVPQRAVVMFTGLFQLQAELYAVFAVAQSPLHYINAEKVWLIYYHIMTGCVFMCYPSGVDSGWWGGGGTSFTVVVRQI